MTERRTRRGERGTRLIVLNRWLSVAVASAAALVVACGQAFRTADYPTPVSLYEAAMEQFRLEKWGNAVIGFEQVTLQLPARDTLLPRAHYYLALSHVRQEDYQLAAASYLRLFESYPGDTLADDALMGAAASYERSWRGPEYDPEFAQKALDAYGLVHRVFPASPLVREAQEGEARMNNGLAQKDLRTGMHFFRRRAYHSALIYFRAAAADYPGTPTAREARMMIVRAYQVLGYREDIDEHCRALRTEFPDAADIRVLCGGVAADTAR